ncbi:MAG: guanylate kinase [Rhodothermales bacterium]
MAEAKKIIALTAPSGSGKTTIARRVLAALPEMVFSVSATTRERRPHEKHGVHYYFVSEDEFRELIAAGELIEHEEVYPGRFYGTLRSEVEQKAETTPLLLDIDVEGTLNVKRLYGDDALTIFIEPPSLEVLAERLRRRNTETETSLRHRLDRARRELTYADRFDAVVVNDDLTQAVDETIRLVRQFLQPQMNADSLDERG